MSIKINDYVAVTLAYLDTPQGAAVMANGADRGVAYATRLVSAIHQATGLSDYKMLSMVYFAIGPAMMARDCRK